MSDKPDNEALTMRLVSIVEQAREHVSRSINTAMVQAAYWLMGREIVESDQAGRTRADYGEALMRAVAKNLQSQFGRGFSYSNVKRMRQFNLAYPQGSPANAVEKGATVSRLFTQESTRFPSAMSWSQYCLRTLNPNWPENNSKRLIQTWMSGAGEGRVPKTRIGSAVRIASIYE